MTSEYYIKHLALQPHPEGGFYKETYRSAGKISREGLTQDFNGGRNYSTAIYFLLRSQDRSLFHRIKSDELWHYHAGDALAIYVLTKEGLQVHTLGPLLDRGQTLQVVVPANCWFGAKVVQSDTFTLAGCTVAPGFDFQDFEMAAGAALLQEFPQHAEVIRILTP